MNEVSRYWLARSTSPLASGSQGRHWINQRHHRRLGARPVERWKADHAAMLALPPVAPGSGWATSLRLPRDHYVRLDGNDYSVDPSAVGRRVLVTADLEQVVVSLADGRDGVRVARHARCWARHQTITDTAHAQAAARLREAYRHQLAPPADTEVAYRDLADYDRLFDIDADDETLEQAI